MVFPSEGPEILKIWYRVLSVLLSWKGWLCSCVTFSCKNELQCLAKIWPKISLQWELGYEGKTQKLCVWDSCQLNWSLKAAEVEGILEVSLHLFFWVQGKWKSLGCCEDLRSPDEQRSGKCSTKANFGTGSVLCLDEGSWRCLSFEVGCFCCH